MVDICNFAGADAVARCAYGVHDRQVHHDRQGRDGDPPDSKCLLGTVCGAERGARGVF